jgi:hypothetical protein
VREAARALHAAIAVFVSLACEQAVTIEGNITVPVDVQQKFSNARKGRLLVASAYTSGETISGSTIHIFCDATTSELTIPFTTTGFGCAGGRRPSGRGRRRGCTRRRGIPPVDPLQPTLFITLLGAGMNRSVVAGRGRGAGTNGSVVAGRRRVGGEQRIRCGGPTPSRRGATDPLWRADAESAGSNGSVRRGKPRDQKEQRIRVARPIP